MSLWEDLKTTYKQAVNEYEQQKKIMTLTEKDILNLIELCHPDKHNGSKKAEKITARLNMMRDIMKKK